MRQIERVQTEDPDLRRVQDSVITATLPLFRNPTLDGLLLEGVTLSGSDATEVAHKLGRPVRGWAVTRCRVDARVWDEQDENDVPEKTLRLRASTDVLVDLWVF
jgi:hypothetical protein